MSQKHDSIFGFHLMQQIRLFKIIQYQPLLPRILDNKTQINCNIMDIAEIIILDRHAAGKMKLIHACFLRFCVAERTVSKFCNTHLLLHVRAKDFTILALVMTPQNLSLLKRVCGSRTILSLVPNRRSLTASKLARLEFTQL